MEYAAFADGAVTPLVAAIPVIAAALERTPTIVGGIAVLCWVPEAGRATNDLDTVTTIAGAANPALHMLRDLPGSHGEDAVGVNIETPFGTARVDVINVGPLVEGESFNTPADRLHVMAHLWAHAVAHEVTLVVMSGEHEVTTATALVAPPGPLVAMKVQAVLSRGSVKEGTDLLDIVRLTLDSAAGPQVVASMRTSDARIAADLSDIVPKLLIEGRARALRQIRAAGGSDVSLENIDDVATLLMEAAALPGDHEVTQRARCGERSVGPAKALVRTQR